MSDTLPDTTTEHQATTIHMCGAAAIETGCGSRWSVGVKALGQGSRVRGGHLSHSVFYATVRRFKPATFQQAQHLLTSALPHPMKIFFNAGVEPEGCKRGKCLCWPVIGHPQVPPQTFDKWVRIFAFVLAFRFF